MTSETDIEFGTLAQQPVTLSEDEIKHIVYKIEQAKLRAAKEGGASHFVGALSVIFWQIDKRIGDAIWNE